MSAITWEEVPERTDTAVHSPSRGAHGKPGKMARISGIANSFEATLLSGALDAEKIPHYFEEHRETAHASLFELTRAWGSVLVPLPLANKVISILEEIREVYSDSSEEAEP